MQQTVLRLGLEAGRDKAFATVQRGGPNTSSRLAVREFPPIPLPQAAGSRMLRRGARGSQEGERRDGGVRVLAAAASIHRAVGHGLARPVARARSGSRRGPGYELSPTQRDACGPGQGSDRIGPPFGAAPDVAYRPAEGWTRMAPAAKGASGRHCQCSGRGAERRRAAAPNGSLAKRPLWNRDGSSGVE